MRMETNGLEGLSVPGSGDMLNNLMIYKRKIDAKVKVIVYMSHSCAVLHIAKAPITILALNCGENLRISK